MNLSFHTAWKRLILYGIIGIVLALGMVLYHFSDLTLSFRWENILGLGIVAVAIGWLAAMIILAVVQTVALIRRRADGLRRWIVAGLFTNLALLGFLAVVRYGFSRHATVLAAEHNFITMLLLELGVGMFRENYGTWPVPADADPSVDFVYGATNQADLIRVLAGQDRQINSNGVVFVEFASRLNDGGQLLSSWGSPFCVAMDLNGDGGCEVPGVGLVRRPVVAWADLGHLVALTTTNHPIVGRRGKTKNSNKTGQTHHER